MKHRIAGAGRALLITLPLLATTACSDGGGGGGSNNTQGFLQNEARVDSGGTEDSSEPELHADGQRPVGEAAQLLEDQLHHTPGPLARPRSGAGGIA